MRRVYIFGVMMALLALLLASAGYVPAQQRATVVVSITVTHRVTLTWNASTTQGVVAYRVYRGTVSGGPYQSIMTANVLSFMDTGVTPGATYYYVVTAIDSSNTESAFSDEVVGTIPNP